MSKPKFALSVLAGLVALAVTSSTVRMVHQALAQTPSPPAEGSQIQDGGRTEERTALPATIPGQIGQAFLEALNSPEPKAIPVFLERRLGVELWNRMNPADYERMLFKLRAQSEGLELARILMSNESALRLLTRSRQGKHWLGVEIICDQGHPGRFSLLGLHPMRGPEEHPPRLPKDPMTESEQVEAIREHAGAFADLGLFSGVVLVARENRILLQEAWGMAHAQQGRSNTVDTRFPTASVGKMFTAVAIGQLIEAGLVDPEDSIGKWFPDFPNAEARRVTVAHLLTHTGGLGDPFDSRLYDNHGRYRRQSDWFETFAAEPLRIAPGSRHEYSNGGYLVLAAIVEEASGRLFGDYVREKIFNPAGLAATGDYVDTPPGAFAVPHRRPALDDPLGIEPRQPKADSGSPKQGTGMGGWTSTAHDMFLFARALREGRLLPRSRTQWLVEGQVSIDPGGPVQYARGFYVVPVRGDRAIGHSGGGGDSGIGAEVEMLWESDYTVIVLSNHDLPEARQLAHSILRFLAPRQAPPEAVSVQGARSGVP